VPAIYLDSSVLLRIVLGQRNALSRSGSEQRITSALAETECLRTLDRLRLVDRIAAEEIATRREAVYDLLNGVEVIEVSHAVLDRAAQPLPLPLKTLDAIHLATAMLWREYESTEVTFATHDAGLAAAARSVGFTVMGV